MKQSQNEDTIAIIRMYSGNYLNDKLGHEIINLFTSDKGNHYVYATPADIGKSEVKAAIFVYYIQGSGMAEVLGFAKIMQTFEGSKLNLDDIHYGGKRLSEIFNRDEEQQDTIISYVASIVKNIKSGSKVYIKYTERQKSHHKEYSKDLDIIELENTKVGEHLTSYVKNNSQCRCDYEQLVRLINRQDCWGEEPQKVNRMQLHIPKKTFMDICHKEYDEVAYSNAIAYFLRKYPEIINEWLDDVELSSTDVRVERETQHIDLLIYDNKNVIVIENKILSPLNNVSSEKNMSQLNIYQEKVLNSIRNNKMDLNGNDKKGIIEELTVLHTNVKTYFYVLIPNYYDESQLAAYIKTGDNSKLEQDYKVIKYNSLYNICKNIAIMEPYCNDEYFIEFTEALHKHARDRNDTLYVEMKRRFMNRIYG